MIPLRDYIPTRRFPIVTLMLILINVAVFALELLLDAGGLLEDFINTFGLVPLLVTQHFDSFVAFTFISSMFMHGGFLHILGNMLYLWIFGNNVEDEMGRLRFLIFYFVAGIAASLAQVIAGPRSTVPGIGASGAIAGVLGAYLVLYPRARVATLIPLGLFTRVADLPAVLVLGFWFVLQLLNGVLSFGMGQMGGVAWFAHIGGFIAGVLLVKPFTIGRRGRYWQYR
jgi:membrane associated rhomboid family serine protease